jgi:hypothetical protein
MKKKKKKKNFLSFFLSFFSNRNSTDYGLDHRGSIPRGENIFSLLHQVQTGSGTHPASCPVDISDTFPGLRRPNVWSWSFTSIKFQGQECVEL